MKLLQIGRDKWTVYVIANEDWSSDVLRQLSVASENDLGARMLSLLREYVPTNGPPHNSAISKNLGKGRHEFRRQPDRGAALRVLYFYDEGRIVLCSNAFWKKTDKTPPEELRKLEDAMARYKEAKRKQRLQIRPWQPTRAG